VFDDSGRASRGRCLSGTWEPAPGTTGSTGSSPASCSHYSSLMMSRSLVHCTITPVQQSSVADPGFYSGFRRSVSVVNPAPGSIKFKKNFICTGTWKSCSKTFKYFQSFRFFLRYKDDFDHIKLENFKAVIGWEMFTLQDCELEQLGRFCPDIQQLAGPTRLIAPTQAHGS
jgi:hypothetical protein